MIYNTTTNCVNFRKQGAWQTSCIPRIDPSTNGTGTVSSYVCNTASTGCLLKIGSPVVGITQTITATVEKVGTYDIKGTAGGVTFSGTGILAAIGPQDIVLTATGSPSMVGDVTFNLNVTPDCSFIRYFLGSDDVCGLVGRVWKDKNVGAARVATSATDSQAFGTGFAGGVAIPCPTGFRIPNSGEILSEFSAVGYQNLISSPLKIPYNGWKLGDGAMTANWHSGHFRMTYVSASRPAGATTNSGTGNVLVARCIKN